VKTYLNSLSISWLLFIIFAGLYLSGSFYLTYLLEIYHNDGLARTALAFFTVYGRDPHLGAIGFVWQPLPSLLQIPLLLSLRPLGLMLLSGPITTSIAGACSVVLIYKISTTLNPQHSRWLSALVAFIFGISPAIFLYSVVGTSEMIFMLCLLLSAYYLIRFFYRHDQAGILLSGVAIALSFWCRYEALPAFAGSVIVVTIYLYFKKFSLRQIESTLLQFCLPFVYSVGLWVLFNWLIMKDPFYFMNSPYSNASFTSLFKNHPELLEYTYHSVLNSLAFAIQRVLYMAPILSLLPLILIVYLKKSARRSNILLLIILSGPCLAIILFHAFQIFKGESFGWLRFFLYAVPFGFLLACYSLRNRFYVTALILVFLILGIPTQIKALSSSSLGREEISFASKIVNPNFQLDFSRTYQDQKEIASLMDTLPGNIIIDTDKGFAVPLFAKDPNRFIITSDLDYLKAIGDYSKYAKWIILPKPESDDRGQNKIYDFYPGIWEGNAPSVKLYRQIEGWRIYQIKQTN
jgi:hypothetical protein